MPISAAPMASGGITPGAPGMTVQPMVSTRKKVPMNSAIYLRIRFGVAVETAVADGRWRVVNKPRPAIRGQLSSFRSLEVGRIVTLPPSAAQDAKLVN